MKNTHRDSGAGCRHRLNVSPLLLMLFFSNVAIAQATLKKPMHHLKITVDNTVITGTLDDTPAVQDLIKQLPLTVKLEDYSATEKITYLPGKLTTQGAPAGIDPDVGDITYYAPWGNIAIFYKDFGYSRGLIRLGRITSGLEHLTYAGSRQATIELIQP